MVTPVSSRPTTPILSAPEQDNSSPTGASSSLPQTTRNSTAQERLPQNAGRGAFFHRMVNRSGAGTSNTPTQSGPTIGRDVGDTHIIVPEPEQNSHIGMDAEVFENFIASILAKKENPDQNVSVIALADSLSNFLSEHERLGPGDHREELKPAFDDLLEKIDDAVDNGIVGGADYPVIARHLAHLCTGGRPLVSNQPAPWPELDEDLPGLDEDLTQLRPGVAMLHPAGPGPIMLDDFIQLPPGLAMFDPTSSERRMVEGLIHLALARQVQMPPPPPPPPEPLQDSERLDPP